MITISGVMLLAGRREAQVVGPGGAVTAVAGAGAGSNCEPIPDMSLFHNLKLKRRKVDSRGSSDGKTYFWFIIDYLKYYSAQIKSIHSIRRVKIYFNDYFYFYWIIVIFHNLSFRGQHIWQKRSLTLITNTGRPHKNVSNVKESSTTYYELDHKHSRQTVLDCLGLSNNLILRECCVWFLSATPFLFLL